MRVWNECVKSEKWDVDNEELSCVCEISVWECVGSNGMGFG